MSVNEFDGWLHGDNHKIELSVVSFEVKKSFKLNDFLIAFIPPTQSFNSMNEFFSSAC